MDGTEVTPERLEAEYHLERERKRVRWDPTINMGHIITMTTSMVMSLIFVMASWSTMDKRVVVLEEARLAQQQTARDRQDQIKDKFDDVRNSVNELKAVMESMRRDLQDKRK